MEEKLVIASYNNPNELPRGWKYLMFVGTRRVDFLVEKSQFKFILFIYYIKIYFSLFFSIYSFIQLFFLCEFYFFWWSFNQLNFVLVKPFFSQNRLDVLAKPW